MFEQFTKALKDAGAGPLIQATQEAGARAQSQVAKAAADATEYAQMEIANAVAFAKSGGPQQAFEAMAKAAQERQAYMVRKSKDMFGEMALVGSQLSQQAEERAAELARHANGAVDAAFASAKQGLGIAESATKSVVEKASKGGSKS